MRDRILCSYDVGTPQVWLLEKEYKRRLPGGEIICVPDGFEWDGASVPRLLWPIAGRWGRFSGAALIHDWIYTVKDPYSRNEADAVFFDLMIEDGVGRIRANVMWTAVRVYGGSVWRN